MGKYDSVDRLMNLATEKPTPAPDAIRKSATEESINAGRSAETVPVAGPERTLSGLERAPELFAAESTVSQPDRSHLNSAQSSALVREPLTPGERGRQLLGALRPFLPAVGGALRMVDHGAVQAVARLLPLLGTMGSLPGNAAAANAREQKRAGEFQAGAAADNRAIALAEELKGYKQRLDAQEEHLRRMRAGLERTVVEQGSLGHLVRQLTERSRRLTAAVVILGMLILAEFVLIVLLLHR